LGFKTCPAKIKASYKFWQSICLLSKNWHTNVYGQNHSKVTRNFFNLKEGKVLVVMSWHSTKCLSKLFALTFGRLDLGKSKFWLHVVLVGQFLETKQASSNPYHL